MTVLPPSDPHIGAGLGEVSFLPPLGSALAWHDLAAAGDAPAKVPTVCGIFYPGSVNALVGEPGVGKSWLAAAVVVAQLGRGGSVVVVDAEDTVATWASRLRALGATGSALNDALYLRVGGAISEADVRWLTALVEAVPDTVVVLDSAAELLAFAGLDEDVAADVTAWHQRVPRPFAHAGACVLVLDHRAKATATRGRWARGSGAKLSAVDGVALNLELIDGFSRDRSGSAQLLVAKDRPGSVGAVGELAATALFDVAGGSLHSIRIIPAARSSHGDWAPRAPSRARRDAEADW